MKNSGYLIETQSGLKGRTYSNENGVNNKIVVHLENGTKMLCTPSKIKIIGFID